MGRTLNARNVKPVEKRTNYTVRIKTELIEIAREHSGHKLNKKVSAVIDKFLEHELRRFNS
jgi:hypothetical protein